MHTTTITEPAPMFDVTESAHAANHSHALDSVSGAGEHDHSLRQQHDASEKSIAKLVRVIKEELFSLHFKLLLARIVLWPIPIDVGGRVRTAILRLTGFKIGQGTIMAGTPTITGDKFLYRNLQIGRGCWFNVGCFFDLGEKIVIGDDVSLGHDVIVLTNSHHIGAPHRRASGLFAKPVTIHNGAWLGSRCTILPGVTIGSGAVIAAGAVVHKDVPPNTLVGGVPARIIRTLS